ncbi:MAG: YhbY family RNA-binding protein [Bacilli bacterium]|nr:YhbY family RNA-binding protein [Bacilli bacterium]
MKGKQKRQLRAMANTISKRHLLGKGAPDEAFFDSIDKALEANELIKIGILETSETSPEELTGMLEEKLGCEVVQVIGRVLVVYRRSKKNPRIVLED